MTNPVCKKCRYLDSHPETFRVCPKIPVIHRDMNCSNPKNAVKDHVTGEAYKPFCEEVNRHGECLFYYPSDLTGISDICFSEETNEVSVYGKSPFIVTIDGTEPNAKAKPIGAFDSQTGMFSFTLKTEHSCIVKAACVLDGVLSDITEKNIEIPDVPVIDFDETTNTVSIKSHNKVFFTTDGSKVSEFSEVYTKPFVITHNTMIKACSFARDDFSKQVEKYCISIEPPVINFDSDSNMVSISADDKILFTTDRSDVYDDSEEYTEPFVIEENTTVKAACIVNGELSAQSELVCKVPDIPSIAYNMNTHEVSIVSANPARYTINGEDVRRKDSLYETPFKISETCTIKAATFVGNKISEQSELKCVFVSAPEIKFDEDTNTVSISAKDKILFSTDGSKIYDDADEYTQPFAITKNTIVNAACIVDGVLSEQATLVCKVPSKPVIKYDERTHTVSIISDNPVLYTTDGSDVKKKDTEYKAAFRLTATSVVKACSIVNNKLSEQTELECVV